MESVVAAEVACLYKNVTVDEVLRAHHTRSPLGSSWSKPDGTLSWPSTEPSNFSPGTQSSAGTRGHSSDGGTSSSAEPHTGAGIKHPARPEASTLPACWLRPEVRAAWHPSLQPMSVSTYIPPPPTAPGAQSVDDLLGPVQAVAPLGLPGGRGGALDAAESALVTTVSKSLKGLEHAVMIQTKHQLKDSELKILGYTRECDNAMWAARLGSSEGTGPYKVELCDGAEGKELGRRLLDVAIHFGRERMESGRRTLLRKNVRDAMVTLSFGCKNVTSPSEGVVICADFPRVEARAVYKYHTGGEPGPGKHEPHGTLPRTWPTFEENAEGMAQAFIDIAGTYWKNDLLSQQVPPSPPGAPAPSLLTSSMTSTKSQLSWSFDSSC